MIVMSSVTLRVAMEKKPISASHARIIALTTLVCLDVLQGASQIVEADVGHVMIHVRHAQGLARTAVLHVHQLTCMSLILQCVCNSALRAIMKVSQFFNMYLFLCLLNHHEVQF